MSFHLNELTFRYPEAETLTLRNIGKNLVIPDDQTTAVLGASGAGKSTLLYVLGLLWDGPLEAGSIVYRDAAGTSFDYRPECLDGDARAGLRQREYGFALQSNYLLPHLTCQENAIMPLALAGHSPCDDEDLVIDLIRRVDESGRLEKDRNRRASLVSGGQKQRIAVVRSVIHDPRVIFADEPFSSLDDANAGRVLSLLHDWRAGQLPHSRPDVSARTLILVCHDVRIANEFADTFLVVEKNGSLAGNKLLDRSDLSGALSSLQRELGPVV